MSNDYNDFDECDVVMEGSDLHKALTDIGCTDFECTPINRSEFCDDSNKIDNPEDSSLTMKHGYLWNFYNKMKSWFWFKPTIKPSYMIKQLEIISRLDPLLDDHSLMIQNLLSKNSSLSNGRCLTQWSISIVSNSLLAITMLIYKPLRIYGFITIPFITAFIFTYTYAKSHSTKNLEELVSIQNNIYCYYKRTLKILKNGYFLKLSHKHSQKKFDNLEIGRVKYLQPMCENFIQSMEKITRTYYQILLHLINFLSENCENLSINNLITKFEDVVFIFDGEITYEKLKRHYYVYILVQSEMMQVLAILYQDHKMMNREISSQLMEIINSLLKLLKKQEIKLNSIIEEYKYSRNSDIRHELKNKVGTKLQDLYLHVDLLSRKIRSAFNVVDSIIDDIDSCTNDDNTDEIINSIVEKMNEAYKEIDTARNFAEFNNLLIGKLRKNQTLENVNTLNLTVIDKIEKILPIVHDTDPQIIDEVFEEYIKDEYLKPLYEDNGIDSLERNKLDKLLAKNFMSELKEVLIDKYKIMSEREARALLCYRKKNNSEQNNCFDNNLEKKVFAIPPPPPPPPPPLPQSIIDRNFSKSEQIKIRSPVPLPRSISTNSIPTARRRRKTIQDLEPEIIEANQKLSVDMNMSIRKIKLPAFTIDEETFIGSGENSDEELIINDDSENENIS